MKKQILLAVAVCSALMLKAGDQDLMMHGGGSSDSKLTIGISVGAALPAQIGLHMQKTHQTILQKDLMVLL